MKHLNVQIALPGKKKHLQLIYIRLINEPEWVECSQIMVRKKVILRCLLFMYSIFVHSFSMKNKTTLCKIS